MKTTRLIGIQLTHIFCSYKILFFWGILFLLFHACMPKEKQTLSSNDQANVSTETSKTTDKNSPPKIYKRIITIGDAVTESVLALGDSSKIVAVGRTCPKYPDFQRPKVGYELTLQTKFILDHKPDLVISNVEASPNEIIQEVQNKKIDYLIVKPIQDMESLRDFIHKIADVLQKKTKGEKILASIAQKLDEAKSLKKSRKDSAKVMYVLARGSGFMLMGGRTTSFDAIIQLAGGKNVATEIEGLQRVTEEDMLNLNPDFLLMSHQSYDSFKNKAYDMPVLYASRAYRFGRVVMMDESKLKSPGVDIGETAYELAKALYQQQYFAPLVPASPQPGVVPERSSDLEIISSEE